LYESSTESELEVEALVETEDIYDDQITTEEFETENKKSDSSG
jgi:hypothetical protein